MIEKSQNGEKMQIFLKTDKFECRYNEDKTDGSLLLENHCHGEFEIIYIMEGGVDLVCEGRPLRCEKGELMLFPPLTYHSITADQSASYKRASIFFQRGTFPAAIEEKLGQNSDLCPVFSFQSLAGFINYLQKAFTSDDLNDYIPLIESLITQTLYQCAELENNRKVAGSAQNEIIDRAIAYIDEHIKEKILLDDLAALLFISKSALCHMFTEQMQTSPKKYILRKKMAYASMLADSGVPITEISRIVGYENYSSFYRIYKKLKDENQM